MIPAAPALRALLYASIAIGAFLAFGWPYAVSDDQADPLFRVVALGTLLLFFAALTACCVMRLLGRRPT